jgi:hypothetical protein
VSGLFNFGKSAGIPRWPIIFLPKAPSHLPRSLSAEFLMLLLLNAEFSNMKIS